MAYFPAWPTFLFPRLLMYILQVQVVWCLQGGVRVEQVGNKRQVQLVVAIHHITGGYELSATDLVRLL